MRFLALPSTLESERPTLTSSTLVEYKITWNGFLLSSLQSLQLLMTMILYSEDLIALRAVVDRKQQVEHTIHHLASRRSLTSGRQLCPKNEKKNVDRSSFWTR